VNLTSPSEVKGLLARLECSPRRSAGQNFLIDRNIRDIVLRAANVQKGEEVLEIGPGLGVLTEELLEQADRVYAVEIDRALHAHLYNCFAENERMVLIHADAMDVDLKGFFRSGVSRFVSNLPYSVGSRILYGLAGPQDAPQSMTVMLQRDVADRITAPVGNKQYGLLTIWLNMFYKPSVVKHVNATCFYPRPQVGSSVVQLDLRDEPLYPVLDWGEFEKMVKYCFTQRRKQLGTILRGGVCVRSEEQIVAAGLMPEMRPEEVDVSAWGRLADIEPEARA